MRTTPTPSGMHAPKAHGEPSPGQNERSEWHPGAYAAGWYAPCRGKWKRLQGLSFSERPMLALALSERGDVGGLLSQGAAPRCSALPWARFLLGFQPVHGTAVVIAVPLTCGLPPSTEKYIGLYPPLRIVPRLKKPI